MLYSMQVTETFDFTDSDQEVSHKNQIKMIHIRHLPAVEAMFVAILNV